VTIALKSLLQQRHLHEYSEFVVEYERRAKELDLPRHASAPTKAQYYRWVGGHIQNLPRGYHCLVLERMFPGWTARELFGHIDTQHAATSNEALFASFAPAVEPAQLAGLWVTCYVFDGTKHHVDLSTVTVTNYAVTARNYPPEPRAEAHASGFRNEIEAGLFGRHLIGRWRNISDTSTVRCTLRCCPVKRCSTVTAPGSSVTARSLPNDGDGSESNRSRRKVST